MRGLKSSLLLLAAALFLGQSNISLAVIIGTGDLDPLDPTTWSWSNETTAYIGKTSDGSLTVNSDDANNTITSQNGHIGYDVGAVGVVTVTGVGSMWTLKLGPCYLNVGVSGDGTLNIEDGAIVQLIDSTATTAVGLNSSSTGLINIDGNGSLLRTYTLYVGSEGRGKLSVTSGGCLKISDSYIGKNSGAVGEVIVSGRGSSWKNYGNVSVGFNGRGTVTITDGGTVDNDKVGGSYPRYNVGVGCAFDPFTDWLSNGEGEGEIVVSGEGSKWINIVQLQLYKGALNITDGGYVSSYYGTISGNSIVTVDGNGSTWCNSSGLDVFSIDGAALLNITNGGIVSSETGTVGEEYARPSLGTTSEVNVSGAGSMWTNSGELSIWCTGRLSITDGAIVSNTYGYIEGSIVVGNGSKWINSSDLYMGANGFGLGASLAITNGGKVSSENGYVYDQSNVIVDGIGSTWHNSRNLSIGNSSLEKGTLNLTNGGAVAAASVYISKYSKLAIDVGRGSTLNIADGSGPIENSGSVYLFAGAMVDPGTYTPILAKSWYGSGTYQAIGGTWSTDTHQFTVTAAEERMTGSPFSLNLATQPRVLITDEATGQTVGASFLTQDASINFQASLIDDADTLAGLNELLVGNESIKSAWQFTINGYKASDPAYLSLEIGDGFSRSDLKVWHLVDDVWTAYDASDLTYDGNYASFLVTGFSGYAVSAVPEPGALVLLVAGLLGLSLSARRKLHRRYF